LGTVSPFCMNDMPMASSRLVRASYVLMRAGNINTSVLLLIIQQ